MHTRIRSLLAVASGLALMCSMANAQLMLSGHTTGSFTDFSQPNTTVTNAPDGSWAQFHTGIPFGASTQSKIDFTNATFTNVNSGDPIQIGIFNITNGITLLGSAAATAEFHIGLQLTSPTMDAVAISTVLFHIDNTPNGPGGVPDTFSVTFDQPPPLLLAGFLVQFHVSVDPASFVIPEGGSIQKGDITVTFTPVPEPSTYAAFGAVLLVGVVAFRRVRGGRSMPSFPAIAA